MAITLPNFVTSAVITGQTLISEADNQLNILMVDVKSYVEDNYDMIASYLEGVTADNAAASALSAEEASTNAEATSYLYDLFQDLFLGAKSADPTNDNDGGILQVGAIYYNSNTLELKFWNGTTWNAPTTMAAYSAANALSSANNAASSASAASTSANNASTYAISASNSANNASNSASAAASHLAAIEAIYDNFDDRYLGAFDEEPVTDNDGNTLLIGAIYFDTVLDHTRFWNGVEWEDPEATATQAASAASASASASATSASASAASATSASTSASAAFSSAEEASISELAAASSAGIATLAESNASTSESNAATSASNAAASATLSLNYKNAAELALDEFTDIYLGAKTSAPSLDNDGDALQDGALYFDTTVNRLLIYDLGNTTWIGLPATTLSGLTDTTLSGLTSGDLLKYNGTTWINTNVLDDIIANSIQLSGGTGSQGLITWNSDEETLDLIQDGTVLQLGQEVQVHVRNNTSSTISNGTVVMATGTLGASGRITVAPYDNITDVKYIIGVTTEDISAGADGKATTFGKIRGINTQAWADGSVLYTTSNGGLTSTVPTTGIKNAIAFVVHSASNGTLMVRVHPENELVDYNDLLNLPTIGNGTLTVTGSTGLSGSGTFTANQTSNNTITLKNSDRGSSQNIFKNMTDGTNTAVADSNNDTFTFAAGTGMTVLVDATNDKVTYTNSAPNVTTNLGYTTAASTLTVTSSDGTNAVLPAATTSLAGVMTSADKTKLDALIIDANNYIHPTYAGDDFSVDTGALTGATVVSDIDINVTTDTNGHVTDANGTVSTRTLTLADLGYTGETNATADQTPAEILTALKTVDGSGSGLDADLLDGYDSLSYGRFTNDIILNNSTTTEDFITELTSELECFQNNYRIMKVSWSYAGSSDLATGHSTIGTIELAGCLIEAWGGTYKHIRISRPNTGIGGAGIYEYTDQGQSYSPGWREIWTSETDGSGSGLDADLLDGKDSTYFQNTQIIEW